MKTKKDIKYQKLKLDEASKLYNILLEIYANKFNRLEINKKKKIAIKNRPKNLSLKGLFLEDHKTLEDDKILEGDKAIEKDKKEMDDRHNMHAITTR